jgi:hypothetical protein
MNESCEDVDISNVSLKKSLELKNEKNDEKNSLLI